jgi:head-tail adaptor
VAILNAGNRDREIVIQKVRITQSDSGMQIKDWEAAEALTVWAEWLPGNSREAWQAQQRLASYVDGVFVTEYLDFDGQKPDADNTRILYDQQIWDVKGWTEIGRRDGFEIAVVARGEL